MCKTGILPFAAEHLDAVSRLERECFSEPWSRAQLEAALTDDRMRLFVAVRNGQVAGYAGMSFVLDEGSVTDIAVFPQFRNGGVGRALVQRLKQCSSALGLSFLTLEVRASNGAAMALYQSEGFVPVGRRRGFYRNPAEDAVLMTWTNAAK
ncbi:MAG: ribosomal protein S18-alanine N-acetyltransferase [Firmicutes bacterium]|nr:ribosomal protein S18-alanine N-acetyltransferase [Bacillota bacterium]